jgi:hypothetical protein
VVEISASNMNSPMNHEDVIFTELNRINISSLSPELAILNQSYIEATVALIWPYSSSHKTLSLLLVEKDIRLRKSRGQVKAIFHGDCAREVAKTHVGIGDNLTLGLENVTWARTGEEISTPGKKVAHDLEYRDTLKLKVGRTTTNFGDNLTRHR